MRAVVSFLIALFVAALSPGGAASAQTRSGPEQLTAAERSFSAAPFGAAEGMPGLTVIGDGGCRQWGECTYGDLAGVVHAFWEGELVVKIVNVADVGEQSIPALDIGTAREMDEVLVRVRAFQPEADIDCREESAASGGGYACGATLGEGWFTLRFDGARRLTEARIDAYHFT